MDIRFRSGREPAPEATEGNLAVLVWSDQPPAASAAELDTRLGGSLTRLLADPLFPPRPGRSARILWPAGLAARSLTVVGCGERAKADRLALRRAGGAAAAALGRAGGTLLADSLFADAPQSDAAETLPAAELVAEIALGAGLRSYRFDRYRTGAGPGDEAEPEAGPVLLALDPGAELAAAEAAFRDRAAVLAGVGLARDLVNEPANTLGTDEFAARLQALAADGLEVEVLGEAELEAIGMRALLAVGRGSERESRVVTLRWSGGGPDTAPLLLAGKGVVFDTGGISIKPAKGMEDMTMDMGGAAAVAGTMLTLARRRAAAHVVGVVGLVENMPDGRAQRPGDIVTTLAGKTVQVNNTDAEGRLVLADLLAWAEERYRPAAMIDLATLTGAMMVALGMENAGFFANDDELAAALLAAADGEGEGLWRMPLGAGYARALKSPVADLRNVGDGPWGGAITAAEFLHAFIPEGMPWAHLDIAGTTLAKRDSPLAPRGATGWGVRTLDRLVRDRYEAAG